MGSWRRVDRFFRLWIVIFAAVAAQMAWVLRPLVGDPKVPFLWFSPREANFLIDLWHTLSKLGS